MCTNACACVCVYICVLCVHMCVLYVMPQHRKLYIIDYIMTISNSSIASQPLCS